MSLRNLMKYLAVGLFVACHTMPRASMAQEAITIFAAASLKNAIDDVNLVFADSAKIKPVVSYAATSTLVKQIEQGAPADIFISADINWMDYASERKLVRTEMRVNLLGNKLVLIAPRDSKVGAVALTHGLDLATLAGDGRIAVADVRAVPAGRYAKAALESLGIWAAVENKLAMAENVRATLVLVSRNEAPLGIVYETDARIDPGMKIVGTFPDGSHEPVTYPVALTSTAAPAAVRYISFMRSPAANAILEKYGISVLIRPTS